MAKAKDPIWLFAHTSQDILAEQIAESSKNSSQRLIVYKKNVQWKFFEDGFPNLFIENVKEMAGKHVIFLASFHEPSVIFEQLSLMHSIPRYLAKSFTVLLPYFPCATMERVNEEGQVATAKTVTKLLSGIALSRNGPCQLIVYDIHALQERFYFSDHVVPRLESALALLTDHLAALPLSNAPLAFAFPDDGAQKRFGNCLKTDYLQSLTSLGKTGDNGLADLEVIVCAKIRIGTSRVVKIREGNPKGCHVIIVDDLVRSGGTLIECAKALLDAGAARVSSFVVHAVFPQMSWHQFVPTLASSPSSTAIFHSFWITDSIPHSRTIAQHPPFQLLSLAPLISEIQIQ